MVNLAIRYELNVGTTKLRVRWAHPPKERCQHPSWVGIIDLPKRYVMTTGVRKGGAYLCPKLLYWIFRVFTPYLFFWFLNFRCAQMSAYPDFLGLVEFILCLQDIVNVVTRHVVNHDNDNLTVYTTNTHVLSWIEICLHYTVITTLSFWFVFTTKQIFLICRSLSWRQIILSSGHVVVKTVHTNLAVFMTKTAVVSRQSMNRDHDKLSLMTFFCLHDTITTKYEPSFTHTAWPFFDACVDAMAEPCRR